MTPKPDPDLARLYNDAACARLERLSATCGVDEHAKAVEEACDTLREVRRSLRPSRWAFSNRVNDNPPF